MKKKAKFIPYVLFSSLRMILTSMALSLAWFVSLAKLDPTGDASATGAYFAYGNGSQEKPFGISQPRHLYNLAWLQYMGKFNKTDSDTGKKQTYYFELAGDIDRTDYALPPIGTKTYPFIGSFNGNSHKITGLTISNNLDDFHQRPYSGVKESDFPEQINIVGFFGVVGSYENTAGINYDTSANQIVDTGLVDLTVKSSSRTTLAGLAAGYVNGKLQGVAVNDSSFQFKENTSPTTITNNLSDYSLVGYVKDKTYLREREKSTSTTNAPSIDNPVAGQGDGEWGSSIDRRSRFKNLHQKYIKAEFPTYTTYEEVKWDSSTSSWTPIPSTKQESTERNPIDKNYYFVSSDTGTDSKGSSVKTASYTFAADSRYYDGTSYGDNRDTDPYVGLSGELSSANYTYLKRQITDIGAKDTFILSDKTGTNYLSAIRSNRYSNAPQASLINTTNKKDAIHLYLDENNNQLYFSLNDRILYIGVAGNRLTVSRNIPSSVWTYDSAHSLLVSEGKYLVFDGLSWTIFSTPENEIVFDYDSVNNSRDSYIFSQDDNYRCLPDNKTAFMGTTKDKRKAAKWIIDKNNDNKIYALDGTTKYYLYYKNQGDWWNPWQIPFVTTNINDTSISSSNTSGYIVWKPNHFVATYLFRDYKLYYSAKLSDTELATYGRWSRNSQAKCSVSGTSGTLKYQCQKIDSPSSSFTDSTDVLETRNKLNPTYFPLTFDEKGTSPSDKNTGYVVSGAKYIDNDSRKDSIGDIRVASDYKTSGSSWGYKGNDLYKSCVSGTKFSDPNFFAYTIKQNSSEASSNNKIKIGDPINKQENKSGYTSYSTLGFKKYYRYILNEASGSRVARGKLLTADQIAYGLHFRNAEISKNNLTTVDYAKINGQEYYGYQLPNDAIDFNLKGEGYINFFAATYFYQNDNWKTKYNNCFFSLHVIERDGSTINSIKEISKIYQNQSASADKAQPSYVYEYTDGTTDTGVKDASGNFIPGTKGTLLFDTRVLTNPDLDKEWENNAAYYFEIPVNKGEFALGSVSGKNKNGAYLRYLDIGAGNKDDNNITIEEHTEIEVKTYSYPYGVDFHSFKSSATVQDSYSDIEGGKSSAVRISSVSGNGTEFQFSYSSSDRSTILNVTGPPSSCKGTYLSPGVLLKNSGSDLDVVESDTTHTVVIDKLTKYALPDSDDATSLKGTSQITMTVDGKTSTREESETFSLECTTAEAKNILEFSNDSGEKLFTIDYSIVKPKKENTGTEWTYDDPIKLVLFYNPKTRRYHVSFIGKDTSLEIMASMTYFNSSLTRDNSTSGFAGVRIDNYSTEKTIDLNKTYTFKAKTSA